MLGLEYKVEEFEQPDTNKDENQGKMNRILREQNIQVQWAIMKKSTLKIMSTEEKYFYAKRLEMIFNKTKTENQKNFLLETHIS